VSGEEARAETAQPARRGPLAGLTRNVFVLGAASCCTDIASEMLAPVRILFLVLVLGTPLPLAGLVEGVAESTASLLKIVAGRLAGRVAWRRPLILAGYGLSAGYCQLKIGSAGSGSSQAWRGAVSPSVRPWRGCR